MNKHYDLAGERQRFQDHVSVPIVAVAAVLDALKRLDEGGSPSVYRNTDRARRGWLKTGPFEWLRRKRKGPDDDDDPPPCPAMAARPPRSGNGGAVAAADLVAA